jgi:predicted RNA methylase
MKRLWILLSVGVLSTGCASPGPDRSASNEVDSAQVNAVERAARKSGVQVYWVNYPRKKSEN